jgi:AcrR family transcriptional regulator
VHELRHPGRAGGLDEVAALPDLGVAEQGAELGELDGEHAAHSLGRGAQGGGIVEVPFDELGAGRGERHGSLRSGVADECADRNPGPKQGVGRGAALPSGGAGHEYWCGHVGSSLRMTKRGGPPFALSYDMGEHPVSSTRPEGPVPDARPRADKQRNRELLVAAATRIVDRDGASASLEEIAREAGVGSATLHRHFGSRRELLSAVFKERVEGLCRRADELARSKDEHTALVRWLEEVTAYIATTRGLAAALFGGPEDRESCYDRVREAGRPLVKGAAKGVTIDDLLSLANGVAMTHDGDAAAAKRLIRLAMHGLAPS